MSDTTNYKCKICGEIYYEWPPEDGFCTSCGSIYIDELAEDYIYPWEKHLYERKTNLNFHNMKTLSGVSLIARERHEQITKHGRTIEADVMLNTADQLSTAASILCTDDWGCNEVEDMIEDHCPHDWNPELWEKMLRKPHLERLKIAGALIAAEIDRINANEGNEIFDVEEGDFARLFRIRGKQVVATLSHFPQVEQDPELNVVGIIHQDESGLMGQYDFQFPTRQDANDFFYGQTEKSILGIITRETVEEIKDSGLILPEHLK